MRRDEFNGDSMREPKNPRVTFVMSVYNDAERLQVSVDSMLNQSYRDIEVIVVDDGSTDESGSILRRIADGDSRLRILSQENRGLTCALVKGCSEARGEFIARQDSDDWSHPDRIQEQLAVMDGDPRIGFVSCQTQYVGPAGEALFAISRPADPVEATRGLRELRLGPPAHGSVIFRRELYERVGGYRAQFYFAQDSDLWLRMVEQAQIAYLPQVRYVAVREADSTSGAQRPAQREFGEIGHLCMAARERGEDESQYLALATKLTADTIAARSAGAWSSRNASLNATYLIGSQLAKNGDTRAFDYLRLVVANRPWHWRAWGRIFQVALLRSRRERRHEKS